MLVGLALVQCECTGLVTLVTEKPEPDFDNIPCDKELDIRPAPSLEGGPGGHTAEVQQPEPFRTCP